MRMTLEQLKDIIEFEKEGPKLDFKWKPWDFKDEEKKGEFIKDLIAIANSQGKGILEGDEGHIIIGVQQVGENFRPTAVTEDPNESLLKEEQLQQIAKDKIIPAPDFEYKEFMVMNYRVGVVEIQSNHRPYSVSKDYGKVREGEFFIRSGSTTRKATRDELRRLFAEELMQKIEELKNQNFELQRQIEKLDAQHGSGAWTLEYLYGPNEHIRHIPVFLLETWEREHRPVSIDEIALELEQRFGISLTDASKKRKTALIIPYLTKAKTLNLDELIENVDSERGLWQLNEKYIPLVQEFRNTEQTKQDWTLEHLDQPNKPHIRAVPCAFLENWRQTESLTMTYEELLIQVKKIVGGEIDENTSLIGVWNRMQKKLGLKSLFIQVKRSTWRLNADYLDLVKQFCSDKS